MFESNFKEEMIGFPEREGKQTEGLGNKSLQGKCPGTV